MLKTLFGSGFGTFSAFSNFLPESEKNTLPDLVDAIIPSKPGTIYSYF